MKIITLLISSIFLLNLVCSCSSTRSYTPTYSWTATKNGQSYNLEKYYRPLVGFCDYRGGYWGEWYKKSHNHYRYIVEGSFDNFEITYYKEGNHPSDFEFKFVSKKYVGIDGSWYKYEGEITIKKSNEEEMRKHYKTPMSGTNALKDYWTFPCTIKRTYNSSLPDDKYIFPDLHNAMRYTYNVWYNGVGRAFTISGEWITSRYDSDPW